MTMKNKSMLLSLAGVLLAASALTALAAGPLTPPGTPGDGSNGGPSLTDVKAAIDALQASDGRTRIPAQTNTYTISQPGNYVLTGNITVASGDGINITASNVTLDLGGFTITSTAATAGGSAILVGASSRHIHIRNGRITSGFTDYANSTLGSGFLRGIFLAFANGTTVSPVGSFVFEDLIVTGVNGAAISMSTTGGGAPSFSGYLTATVARRITVDGKGGIRFFDGTVDSGKVIDCSLHTANGELSVTARMIGQVSANGINDVANGANGFFDNKTTP